MVKASGTDRGKMTQNCLNHWILVLCCSCLSLKKEANLPVLTTFISTNYRVHLLLMSMLFFFPVNYICILGKVYLQQSFARCSICGEVLNQCILYRLRLSLSTYFYFMWCDSLQPSLLPHFGKDYYFFCSSICLSALLKSWHM